MTGGIPGRSSEAKQSRIARLFDEFLAAAEEGRDISAELLERAGEERAELAARIAAERELRALAHEPETAGDAQHLGRFRILGRLGRGGLGRVYLAHDPKLGRRIALKVLQQRELLDKEQSAWILNEARSLARTSHPGVVRVFEVGEADGQTYVAMEHLPGPSLEEVIQEWRRRRQESGERPSAEAAGELVTRIADRLAPYSARIECLARLAEALGHCHDHGILHRDIKPANVLFDAEGGPRLIDFGLAHVEGADEDSQLGLTQQLVGTAAHIAPEQVASDRTGADPRSDQFAFASLAYECFALENPFQHKTRRATLDAVEAADPPSLAQRAPAVPPDLVRVIRHAHEREPQARYPSLTALAVDLRAILASRPVSVADPSLARLARLWLRRHRRGVTVAAAAFAVALVLLAAGWSTLALRERAALLESAGALRPEEFTASATFFESFVPIYQLQRRAQAFDAGWLRARLFGATSPPVEELAQRWSRELGRLLAAEEERRGLLRLPPPVGLYPPLFVLDAILAPTSTGNAEPRSRGRVEYPEELLAGFEPALDQLAQLDVSGETFEFAFRPTPILPHLESGTYRLQAWLPGASTLWAEVVFYVPEGWPPLRRIELVPPRAELVTGTTRLQPARVPMATGNGELRIPGFRILDRLVTRAEYEAFVAETGYRPPKDEVPPSDLGPDDPAIVTYDSALAFAAWAGGCLPSRAQLRLAIGQGRIELASGPKAGGEFTLDLAGYGNRLEPTWIEHQDLEPDAEPLLRYAPRQGLVSVAGGTRPGFRLVFSDDRPEAYRAQAELPFERSR
ncbi:MAG TPA: protein kinase [Planctomycetota bacterium]